MTDGSPFTVRDNPSAARYEVEIDGHLAIAQYRRHPGVITFTHSEVPDALAGRGIASAIARYSLDRAREEGLRVVPACPFYRTFLARHPNYSDLVAPSDH